MSHEKLRQAIIAANPEIDNSPCTCKLYSDENGCLIGKHTLPIQLHHVLIAIQHSGKDVDLRNFVRPIPIYLTNIEPGMLYMRRGDVVKWDLSKPFSEQSDECLSFLTELLCNEK